MSESIGAQLRKARQDRGLTIGEAAQATRIRSGYLQALEDGQYSELPSPVQGRGFLRNYAEYLDIPVEPLLEAWPGRPQPLVMPPDYAQADLLPDRKSRPVHALPPLDETSHGMESIGLPEPGDDSFPYKGPDARSGQAAVRLDRQPGMEAAEPAVPGGAGSIPFEQDPALQARSMQDSPASEALPPVLDTVPASRSQAILMEIGVTLHTQRERLSLSLADIERYTHLRLHYLKALESGRLDELPSPTQGRGMLNNYARFLNLDADRLLSQFADALIARREERLGSSQPDPHSGMRRPGLKPPSRPAVFRFISLDLLVGSGLVLALIVVVIWTASRVMAVNNEPEGEPTAPSISEMLLATSDVPAGTGSPAPEPSAEGQPAGGTPPSVPIVESAWTPTPASLLENVTPPPFQEGAFQVSVIALQRVWLKVTVDGQVEFQGRTKPGSVYTYPADDQVELLTGNAAGLQIVFNQESLGQLGSWSEVVHRVFTREGAFAPTPTASATPTRTPRMTMTPTPTETLKPSITPRSTIPAP